MYFQYVTIVSLLLMLSNLWADDSLFSIKESFNHNKSYTKEIEVDQIDNQQGAGNCWMFSCCAVMEMGSATCKKDTTQEKLNISEDYVWYLDLIDKSATRIIDGSEISDGNQPIIALELMKYNGAMPEGIWTRPAEVRKNPGTLLRMYNLLNLSLLPYVLKMRELPIDFNIFDFQAKSDKIMEGDQKYKNMRDAIDNISIYFELVLDSVDDVNKFYKSLFTRIDGENLLLAMDFNVLIDNSEKARTITIELLRNNKIKDLHTAMGGVVEDIKGTLKKEQIKIVLENIKEIAKVNVDLFRAWEVSRGRVANKIRSIRQKIYDEGMVKAKEIIGKVLTLPPEKFEYRGEEYDAKSFYKKQIAPFQPSMDLTQIRLAETTFDEATIMATIKKTIDNGFAVSISYLDALLFRDTDTGIYSLRGFRHSDENLITKEYLRSIVSFSSRGHAVAIVGYDLDEQGKIIKFKIRNSWGDDNGDKGFYHMYLDYFKVFVDVLAVPSKFAPIEYELPETLPL